MKKILKIFIVMLAVILFIGTFVFLYIKSREKPVVFKTVSPFQTDIILKTVASGSVIPRKEIEIKPKVSGIVDSVHVEAGQRIQKGDLIAQIKIIPEMVSLNNAESRLRKAMIVYEDSRKTYERKRELFKKKIINDGDFQAYETSYLAAKEEVGAAEDNLSLIREGMIKKYEKMANTSVRSTTEGMVLDVPVEVGDSVIESNTFNDGTTIAIVADMNDMIFSGKVDESEIGKIREGMDLILTVGAIEGERFHATLEYISPKGVEESGAVQFDIKASIDLKEHVFLRAGYSANADIVLDKRTDVLALSESVLQFEKGKPFVEVEIAPQKFEKRYIEIGLSDSINIEILSGVTAHDKIKVWNRALK